jgi:hypothetical protein
MKHEKETSLPLSLQLKKEFIKPEHTTTRADAVSKQTIAALHATPLKRGTSEVFSPRTK